MTPSFLPFIHYMRGVAILFVVSVHARGYDFNWTSNPQADRFLDVFFDPSEGNGTVLFLFIGGFLFQYLTHDHFIFSQYLGQKFKVIILPYLIISIPLIILRFQTGFDTLSLPEDFSGRSMVHQFGYFLLTGAHMPPFWFIATIILIYFTAPLLHALDNEKFYKYGFPLFLLFCFFTYRPENNADPLLAYLHYLPVYIAGMWASYHREVILKFANPIFYSLIVVYTLLSILDLAGMIGVSRDLTFEQIIDQQLLIFNVYIVKALLLCFLLMLLFYKLRAFNFSWLSLLANYSFGIFFVHYIFISISRKIPSFQIFISDFSVPIYVIYFLLILGASVATVYFTKKLAGKYSRYVIGS